MKIVEKNERYNRKSGKDASYDHVLKYIGILGSVQGLKMLVQLVRNKLSSVLLGPIGTGVGASLSNASDLINKVTNLGLSFGTVRNLSDLFENGTEEDCRHFVCVIRTWGLITASLGALLCLILSPFLCAWCFDGDSSYTLSVCLLSFFVFTMPLEAVECSIVKGMRRLKSLAYIETSVVFGTFFLTIPLYYFLGADGVVISLILSGIFTLVIHLLVTTRMFPWHIDLFNKKVWLEGIPLLKMGIPYAVADIARALSVVLIYGALESLHEKGLYRQGTLILTISSGLIFSAMDSDFFPRLSSANTDTNRMNKMTNQQIQVNILLVTPMLIVMSLFMSRLIYLLSASEFIPVAPMIILSVFYVLLEGIAKPVAFFPLAKGKSLLYMLVEITYDVSVAALIYFGYKWGSENLHLIFDGQDCGGLAGTGIGMSLAAAVDLFLVRTIYGKAYGFRFERRTLVLAGCEFLCLAAVIPFSIKNFGPVLKYSVGFAVFVVSVLLAWRLLSKESSFVKRILHKFHGSDSCDCC